MGRASQHLPRNLPPKLRMIRERRGVSQNELIRELGLEDTLSQAEVSAFELGKRIPPLIVLLKYARLHGVHIDDLVDDDIGF